MNNEVHLVFFLFAACAPSFDVDAQNVDPLQTHIVPVLPAQDAEIEVAVHTPVASSASRLVLTLPPDADFYELRPYHVDEEVPWIGPVLTDGEVTSESVSITLPRVAPQRDRAESGDGTVVYAVSLRAADEDGEPGAYTGLAPERLVYIHRDAPEGASRGWNLAVNEDDARTWIPLSDGVVLTENLVGGDTLTFGGYSEVDIQPGTHLALVTGDGAMSAFDAPIAPDWSVTLPGAPPAEALTESDPVRHAVLSVVAYKDDGGDNRLTDEGLVGTACLGLQAVHATWFNAPYDLVGALIMQDTGTRAGWGLSVDTEDGRMGVLEDMYDGLLLAESCE